MTGFLVRPRRRGVLVMAVGAALAMGALAGCSSGSKSTTSATTLPKGGGGASTTVSAGGDQSKQLNDFAASIKSGKQATFKAVYTYSGSGSNGTVTIEQKPPKTVFMAGGGEVIGTGTTTYFCSTGGTTPSCLSSGTSNPLAALSQLFNPDNAVTAIQQAESAAAAHASGYNVSFSTQSFAGLDAECVTVAAQSETGKYCVTKTGILAYSGTATENFVLTSFSGNVSDSAFDLPAGASTVTLPPGVSIPGAP